MVDNTNPNSNFHPYQPVEAVPKKDLPESGIVGLAEKAGINPEKLKNMSERVRSMNARDWLDRGRSFAQNRPAVALGTIAAFIIGAGLMRRRSNSR